MRVGRATGEGWLRLGDAAAELGVSLNTLRRWSDAGALRCYRTSGGHRRYRRTDIETLLHAASARAPAPAPATDPPVSVDGADRLHQSLLIVARVAAEGLDVPECRISLCGADDVFVLLTARRRQTDAPAADEILTGDLASTAREVLRTGRRLVITDLSNAALDDSKQPSLRDHHDVAVLAVPAPVTGRHRAVLELLETRSSRVFSGDDITFAEFMARQIARLIAEDDGRECDGDERMPVDSASGFDATSPGTADVIARLQRRTRDLALIVETGLEVTARLSTEEILHAVAARLAEETHTPVVDIYALEGDTLRALVSYDNGRFDAECVGVIFPLSRYPVSKRAAETGEPTVASSLDALAAGEDRASLEK